MSCNIELSSSSRENRQNQARRAMASYSAVRNRDKLCQQSNVQRNLCSCQKQDLFCGQVTLHSSVAVFIIVELEFGPQL